MNKVNPQDVRNKIIPALIQIAQAAKDCKIPFRLLFDTDGSVTVDTLHSHAEANLGTENLLTNNFAAIKIARKIAPDEI